MKKINEVQHIVQVISIVLISEAGRDKLIKEGFSVTAIPALSTESKIKKFTAQAPNNGVDQFVVFQYDGGSFLSFSLFLIDRGTKKIIAEGKAMTPIDVEGVKIFFIIGEGINDWEIHTVPASKEILEKVELFKDGSTEISRKKVEPIRGDMDLLEKLYAYNQWYAEFVKVECDGDNTVTTVSDKLFNYLNKHGMSVNDFILKIDFLDTNFFRFVLATRNLHPELRSLLNVSLKDHKEKGTEKIPIPVGALLSQINPSKQKEAWEEIKNAKSQYDMLRKLRRIMSDLVRERTEAQDGDK